MRISDWSSDVCSSDLFGPRVALTALARVLTPRTIFARASSPKRISFADMDVTPGLGIRDWGFERAGAGCRIGTGLASAVRFYESRIPNPESQIGRASCRERVCQYV